MIDIQDNQNKQASPLIAPAEGGGGGSQVYRIRLFKDKHDRVVCPKCNRSYSMIEIINNKGICKCGYKIVDIVNVKFTEYKSINGWVREYTVTLDTGDLYIYIVRHLKEEELSEDILKRAIPSIKNNWLIREYKYSNRWYKKKRYKVKELRPIIEGLIEQYNKLLELYEKDEIFRKYWDDKGNGIMSIFFRINKFIEAHITEFRLSKKVLDMIEKEYNTKIKKVYYANSKNYDLIAIDENDNIYIIEIGAVERYLNKNMYVLRKKLSRVIEIVRNLGEFQIRKDIDGELRIIKINSKGFLEGKIRYIIALYDLENEIIRMFDVTEYILQNVKH